MGIDGAGVEAQGLLEARFGGGKIPSFDVGQPKVVVPVREIRLEAHRLPEENGSFATAPQPRQRHSQVAQGIDIIGLVANRFLVSRGSLVITSQFSEYVAKAMASLGAVRLAADGFLKRDQGLRELLVLRQGHAQVVVRLGMVRANIQYLPKQGNGFLSPALPGQAGRASDLEVGLLGRASLDANRPRLTRQLDADPFRPYANDPGVE